jgi:hypothetical protein
MLRLRFEYQMTYWLAVHSSEVAHLAALRATSWFMSTMEIHESERKGRMADLFRTRVLFCISSLFDVYLRSGSPKVAAILPSLPNDATTAKCVTTSS